MSDRRRRSGGSRIIGVDQARFATGLRLLDGEAIADVAARDDRGPRPDIVVDVVRAADLLSFTVEGYGIELVGGAGAHLRPISGRANPRLVFRFAFQHLGERAIYEGTVLVPDPANPALPPIPDPVGADGPGVVHQAPISGALPARGSRIALAVPADAKVGFTTAGLLEALEQLPMAVHPLARPATGQPSVSLADGLVFHLPAGLIAVVSGTDLVVQKPPARMRLPDTSTTEGLATIARDTRRVRELLTRSSAQVAGRNVDLTLVPDRVGLQPRPPIRAVRLRPELSRDATATETAIEAPFRLVLSPSALGGWAHAKEPVRAQGAEHRVELWHTRLGVRREPPQGGGPVVVDERIDPQRVIRAVWARDRERWANWQEPGGGPTHQNLGPFRMSLDEADRHILVRQSAETWVGKGDQPIRPEPVDVEALYVSALGAWLDLHGDWETLPYSQVQLPSILTWDHVAPMGRDQYVRVVYPGYLYPFGHRCTLVKVTERRMKDASPSVAGLYQRKFLVVGERTRTYGDPTHLQPFTEVTLAPLITPTLSPDPEGGGDGPGQDKYFFPHVNNQRFDFTLHTVDQEGRKLKLTAPLLWVAEHFNTQANRTQVQNFYRNDPAASRIGAGGRDVAFAPPLKGGDTSVPTQTLHFDGTALLGTSKPFLADADVRIPAAENLSPIGVVNIAYDPAYKANGFAPANAGQVWAKLTAAPPKLSFGGAVGSDKAGGFLQPDLEVQGLSRTKGTVGDTANTAAGTFNPQSFLGSALPKLFGIVPLGELLDAVGVDLSDAPTVVSEALDRIEGFIADVEHAWVTAAKAVADTTGPAKAAAQDLLDDLTAAAAQLMPAIQAVAGGADVDTAMQGPRQALLDAVAAMRTVAPQLPPLYRDRLLTMAKVLGDVLDAVDLFDDIVRFVQGISQSSVEGRFRYEWRPKVKSWPSESQPFLKLQPRSLVIAVEGRVKGKGEAGVEVLAQLSNFSLILFNVEPLAKFHFDHLAFKAGSSGKAEVDVVFDKVEFVGVLAFVETLKELIPFDGFSDPPYLDVSPSGLEAGFTLALPNVSIGVFSLSNMSLGADIRVPFLGDVVTVGFNFCTRERPFNLSVVMLGGGGWFLIRLSPNGLVVLELGLEAGATLSVDFGVASGSISATIGIYIRLEGDNGSLTAYFRLRGEVDVLGLISASIELYLALTYHFPTGKLVGEAMIRVKVEVFIFSGTVTIRAQRKFAGSNGDPSLRQIMGLEPDGTSPEWSRYCLAFAGA